MFWIELKLNDGDAECWLFKADMLDFVVETFIEYQLIDTFKENVRMKMKKKTKMKMGMALMFVRL